MKTHLWHVRIKPGQTVRTNGGVSITNRNSKYSANLSIVTEATKEPVTKEQTNDKEAISKAN